MDNIEKLRKDFEEEKANIRANYMLNILIVLAYIIFDKIGTIELFGEIYNAHYGTAIVGLLLILFFIKDLILYSKIVIKKYALGVV